MDSYFYDDKGVIRTELLESKAKSIAEKLKNEITSTQLRNYFNEVKYYDRKLKENDTDEYFYQLFPLIKMLKAKVVYGTRNEKKEKKEKKFPQEFVDFMIKTINEIKNRKDFKAFVYHFEAILGYFYSSSSRENN